MVTKPIPNKKNTLDRLKKYVPIMSIVDVGVRECTSELIRAFPTHKHYLFEPVELFFEKIKKNYQNIDYQLFPIALSNENDSTYLIYTSLGADGRVTHSKIGNKQCDVDGLKVIDCKPIQIKRFDALDVSRHIDSNFLLKVDVDGQDLNVVIGFGDKLKLASIVVIECTYVSFTERISFLIGNGFQLVDIVDLVYYGPSLYQFDAVLVRKDLANESLRPSIANFKRELWKPFYTKIKSDYANGDSLSQEECHREFNIVVYNADWQYPAITEKHAYIQAKKFLNNTLGVVYFGFPWATLIDLLNSKKSDAQRLLKNLKQASALINKGERVITVCQHIHMLKYQNMFAEAGINYVFWAHATKAETYFPKHPLIRIQPFPLYPVQVDEKIDTDKDSNQRSFLYSFVGARADEWYLTQSRNHILDYLVDDERGFIKGRDTWHFNKIVYHHQIEKKTVSPNDLIDKQSTTEFKKLLKSSIFSLCPSGSGSNSIRLWESIGFGSIPVIIADTYLPPGNQKLWDEAVVFCPENIDDIKSLPDKLEEIAKNELLLKRKRHALKQIWTLYGPDSFIYDIQKLSLKLLGENVSKISPPSLSYAYESLMRIAKPICSTKMTIEADLSAFISGCSIRALSDPNSFSEQYRTNNEFRGAFKYSMANCSAKQRHYMQSVIIFKGIEIIW